MATHLELRKRKNRSHRFHPILIATCTTGIFFAVNAIADPPISYPNGQVVWRGNIGDTVFHENGQVAWRGSPSNKYLTELQTSIKKDNTPDKLLKGVLIP